MLLTHFSNKKHYLKKKTFRVFVTEKIRKYACLEKPTNAFEKSIKE